MDSITLFSLDNHPEIRISITLSFTAEGQLYFDGYDIGKRVKEAWGDSDYEYTYTIAPAEVDKLYALFHLQPGDRKGLLEAIKKRFGVNEAYTLFGDFMRKNGIQCEGFTWT